MFTVTVIVNVMKIIFIININIIIIIIGKPFVVVSDSNILSQIIVENANKLTKHHAFGILELFRKTDLISGPAWKVVHRIASKFPINDNELQQGLHDMLSSFVDSLATINSSTCFADYTRKYYWDLVLFLVCGPTDNKGIIIIIITIIIIFIFIYI